MWSRWIQQLQLKLPLTLLAENSNAYLPCSYSNWAITRDTRPVEKGNIKRFPHCHRSKHRWTRSESVKVLWLLSVFVIAFSGKRDKRKEIVKKKSNSIQAIVIALEIPSLRCGAFFWRKKGNFFRRFFLRISSLSRKNRCRQKGLWNYVNIPT